MQGVLHILCVSARRTIVTHFIADSIPLDSHVQRTSRSRLSLVSMGANELGATKNPLQMSSVGQVRLEPMPLWRMLVDCTRLWKTTTGDSLGLRSDNHRWSGTIL